MPETTTTTAQRSPYLRPDEAADYCRVAYTTIWRAVRSGKLTASGTGRAVRYHRDDLDDWMRARNRR